MARQKDKIYMPMGAGGLLRYQEEEEEMFVIKPKHVVVMVIGIILFEIMLKFFLA
jgi:preprotein translocase subunit Sec61beta